MSREIYLVKLVASIVTIISINTIAQANPYPFAPFPLAIEQSKNSTTTNIDGRIRPNIMFLIDDTYSMSADVKGNYRRIPEEKQRMTILRNAMNALINEYDPNGNNFNYYLLDLCGTSKQIPKIGSPLGKDTFLNIISNTMEPLCGFQSTDHSLEGFYDAIYFMRKNMNEAPNQYRCQTNTILFFSDGELNYTKVKTDSQGVAYTLKAPVVDSGKYKSAARLLTEAAKEYAIKYPSRYYYGRIDEEKESKGIHQRWWDCPFTSPGGGEYSIFGSKKDKKCRYQDAADWHIYAKFAPNQDWTALVQDKNREGNYSNTYYNGQYHSSIGKMALGGPANWIKENDLVTNPRLTEQTLTDAAGKSWDDPDFKNQTISTFSIGLGVAKGGEYLDGAAASAENHKAILAQNEQELIDGFKNIFEKIKQSASLNIPESYSYTSPATLGAKKLSGGIGVYLADGLSQSALRIFSYVYKEKNGKNESAFDESSFKTPDYSNRRLFVSWQTPSVRGSNLSIEVEPTEFYDFSNNASVNQFINTAKNSQIISGDKNIFSPQSIFGLPENASILEVKDALIPWLVGNQSDTQIAQQYPEYRIRPEAYPMGDIVDSPVISGGRLVSDSGENCTSENYDNTCLQEYLVTSANDGMTYVFKRKTNDDSHPYQLSYRYLPMQMDRGTTWEGTNIIASNLYELSRNGYAQPERRNQHLWLNNGGITMRTVELEKDGNQQTFMVATPGQGGRGVYGLNIGGYSVFSALRANPVGVDNPQLSARDAFIFDTPKGWYNDTGYIIGNPAIARMSLCRDIESNISTSKNNSLKFPKPHNISPNITVNFDSSKIWTESTVSCLESNGDVSDKGIGRGVMYTTIYGSGFESPSDAPRTALIVRQIFSKDFGKNNNSGVILGKAGALIRRINIDSNSTGLAMPTVIDMDFDGVADLAYALTKDGDLYRFDFRAEAPREWSAVKIFSTPVVTRLTADDNGNVSSNGQVKQPVIIAPSVYRFLSEDGKIRFIVTFGTGSNLYNSDLRDRTVQSIYSIEDRPEEELNPTIPKLQKGSSNYLVHRTLSDSGNKRKVANLDSASNVDHYVRGWYANLDSTYNNQPSGERIVQSPIVTFGSSIYSSVMYVNESSNYNNLSDENDPCKVTKVSSKDTTKGWVMLFNAKTGDAGGESVAGLDIFNQGETSNNEVGLKQENGDTGLSLFLPALGDNIQELATNSYGQLGSGLDSYVKLPYTKDCIDPGMLDKNNYAKLIGQNRKGLDNDLNLILPICKVNATNGLLRLNFREIKM